MSCRDGPDIKLHPKIRSFNSIMIPRPIIGHGPYFFTD